MDVRDYSIKADKARDRYREAQEDLRASYDKNVEDIKSTYEQKTEKQARNYSEQKQKLEEQNLVNNDLYSSKTKEAVSKKQEDFKKRLKENVSRFEDERNNSKLEFKDKLSNLSEAYKKSADESNHFNDQTKRIMGERYQAANKRYQEDFNKQITNLEEKSKTQNIENRDHDKAERQVLAQKYGDNMENLRSSNNEQKFKEVSRLRGDIENLRTTFDRERDMLVDRQDERIVDMVKSKHKESNDNHQNFENLQSNLRQKNLSEQERQNQLHKRESKELSEKFNDDVRNIQRVTNQKVQGGTQVDTLQDELKQTKTSYENRLDAARKDLKDANQASTEKEEFIDKNYRDKFREMKSANVEKMEKKDQMAGENLKKSLYELKEKNNAVIDRYKGENFAIKNQGEEKIAHVAEKGHGRLKEQRIEFGKVVNTMNEKNMNTIASLKEDFSKDKSESIEKSKKEFNDEKVNLKTGFNRQITLKESLYEQRLAEMEKQTNKIIENYENRISQIVRKADKEVETIKNTEEERKIKEGQALKISMDNMQKAHRTEVMQMRDRFENMVAKDRVLNEQQMNRIVQKYEDQLDRERNESQKTMSIRLSEAQAQLERLYKSSEAEKENIRAQSESKIENMKLASMAQEKHSKKV